MTHRDFMIHGVLSFRMVLMAYYETLIRLNLCFYLSCSSGGKIVKY